MREVEFEGYWSERDKQLWQSIDWKARDYKEFPVEDEEPIKELGHFYTTDGSFTKQLNFVKYLRANPIYPPYIGPVIDTELSEFMREHHFCYPMYDGRNYGNYHIHDRFESNEVYDMLSR